MFEWLKSQVFVNGHFSLVEFSEFVLALVGLVTIAVYKPWQLVSAYREKRLKAKTVELSIEVEQRGSGINIAIVNTSETATAHNLRIISDCFQYPLNIGDLKPGDVSNKTYSAGMFRADSVIEVHWLNPSGKPGFVKIPYFHDAWMFPHAR